MKKTWSDVMILLAVTIVVATLIIGIWKIERAVNYRFEYSDNVEGTIKSLVKPECLKP